MSVAIKQRMSATLRRDQILGVALQVAVSEGFYLVTMDRLAHETGVTRTLIYQLFGNLPGVLVALMDREFNKGIASFLQSASRYQVGDQEQFVAVMSDLIVSVDAEPAIWRLFLMPPEGAPPELHERLKQSRELVRQFLEQSLLIAKDAGKLELTQIDVDLVVRTMQVVGEELLRLHLHDPVAYHKERLLLQVRKISKLLFMVGKQASGGAV
ncbi:MAG: TetR/AcrR family transcriptional regulator [Pseudomonadota bacterium]